MYAKTALKAFVIGSSIPVTLITFTYLGVAHYINPTDMFTFEVMPISISIMFGLLNILYLYLRQIFPQTNRLNLYWMIGLFYGLGLSLYGNFVSHLPQELFMLPESYQRITIPIALCIYAFVWRFIVKNLNELFELEKL